MDAQIFWNPSLEYVAATSSNHQSRPVIIFLGDLIDRCPWSPMVLDHLGFTLDLYLGLRLINVEQRRENFHAMLTSGFFPHRLLDVPSKKKALSAFISRASSIGDLPAPFIPPVRLTSLTRSSTSGCFPSSPRALSEGLDQLGIAGVSHEKS